MANGFTRTDKTWDVADWLRQFDQHRVAATAMVEDLAHELVQALTLLADNTELSVSTLESITRASQQLDATTAGIEAVRRTLDTTVQLGEDCLGVFSS